MSGGVSEQCARGPGCPDGTKKGAWRQKIASQTEEADIPKLSQLWLSLPAWMSFRMSSEKWREMVSRTADEVVRWLRWGRKECVCHTRAKQTEGVEEPEGNQLRMS